MKKIKLTVLLCCLLLLAGINTYAQVLESIERSFKAYNDNILQEKLYVHTDKNFYVTGEILWFKIYNVDAGTNIPINISKVAYVELLDDTNTPVLQAKISLTNNSGSGSFFLPVTLKNGNYKFRAYTSWMKNFSTDLYFEKAITIINPLIQPAIIAEHAKGAFSIQFFPEGGNLLNGVANTVGFKAIDTDGKGIDVSGVVVDQRNDTVARFQSLKFGIGSFLFTPNANNSYRALLRTGQNNVSLSNMPAIATNGYALHLVNTGNNTAEAKITTLSQGGSNLPVYFFVYNGHRVIMAQSVVPGADGSAAIQIDKEKLGQGVNHLVLFNSLKQPVCERLYFKRPDLLTIRAQALQQYKTRSPVSVNVSANTRGEVPRMANMSVAVYRLDSLNNTGDLDIASYLWLSSELKGNIESPGYYFDVITAETDNAVDNLMLTQGWSRFKWDDVFNNKPVERFTWLPEYNGHIITGSLKTAAGAPATDIHVYLGVIGKRLQLYGSIADSTGRLLFNTKDLYGPGEIVLQTNTEKDSTYTISTLSPFSDQYSSNKLPPFKINSQSKDQLEINSVAMQVQNMYNRGKLKQYYNPVTDSSSFFKRVGKTYMLDDFTRFSTIEEIFREYVTDLNVVKPKGNFRIKVSDQLGFLDTGDPLVLLDGIPIFNMNKVFTINPLTIKRLDYVNQKYYWGPIFASGILSFTSYKSDMGGFELDPRAVVLDYEGMQLEREFYSPVYETPALQKSHVPDFRNVLYWAPGINTNAQGKAVVSFYTSDQTGKYIAVFQGITPGGSAGSYSLKFDVSQ